MKKKVLIVVLVVILLIVLLVIGKVFIDKKILEDEQNQVLALKKIYNDFMEDYDEYKNVLKLDESIFKNLITKQYFKEENKNILKGMEGMEENLKNEVILSSIYNVYNNVLTVKLEIKSNERIVQTVTNEYKLYIKNWKINYDYGIKNIVTHTYAN